MSLYILFWIIQFFSQTKSEIDTSLKNAQCNIKHMLQQTEIKKVNQIIRNKYVDTNLDRRKHTLAEQA